MENKKLNDILISNKLNFEEEIRDVKNKARDEEIKRTQQLTRSYEQKLKMVEEGKEVLLRKNQEMLRALQEKERELDMFDGEKTEEVNKLRQDCGDLHQQNSHLNFLLAKYKQEIADKDALIARGLSDNDTEVMTLRQQLEAKKSENAQMAASIRELRSSFKENENDWERRKRELLERNTMLDGEARKYRDEYTRICDVLKSKINTAIDHVSYKK
jgi:chromosome segregation ATPase